MINARNTPNTLPLPFCVTVLCSILAWCAGISASDNAQRPYVPPGETPPALRSTPEQVAREVLIQVAPGFMDFPEGKVVAEWLEFQNSEKVNPAYKSLLTRHSPERLMKVFPTFDPVEQAPPRSPHDAGPPFRGRHRPRRRPVSDHPVCGCTRLGVPPLTWHADGKWTLRIKGCLLPTDHAGQARSHPTTGHVSTTREADHLLPSSVEQKRQNTAFKSLFQPSHSGTPHLGRAAGQTQFARLSISVAIPR